MKKWNLNNILIIISIIIVCISLLIFGTKSFLYIRALLGNDLTITLNADKENLFLRNNESDIVKIKIYALSNLFCTTACNTKFIDLSSGNVMEADTFNLKLLKTKEFTLTASKFGKGQILYRFDIECDTIKTYFCESRGETKKRTLLLTLNYDLNQEEIILKNSLKNILDESISGQNYIFLNLNEQKNYLIELNKTCKIEETLNTYYDINNKLINLNKAKESILNLWEIGDYNNVFEENKNYLNELNDFKNSYNEFNNSLMPDINLYNGLIANLTIIRQDLEEYQNNNFSFNSSKELKLLIYEYNNLTITILEKQELPYKQSLVNSLYSKIISFNETLIRDLNNSLSLPHRLNETLFNINLSKINILEINYTNIEIPESFSICCLDNWCKKCCDETCNNKTYYPIILLHGHSFSEKTSADISLDAFENMQRELDKDNYLNAGSILINPNEEVKGVLSNINEPLTFKASYYFDIMNNQGDNVLIQTKTDNLDTYTLRLRDIINTVKYKTGKDKVIVITHSMGGLIARKYLQVFGEDDINKLIMITSPNHGISGNILNYCYWFGTKLECNDMNKDSLFINKLNSGKKPNIPIYNIIGTGCDTGGENGDGVVTNKSAYLDYAKNIYIKGNCGDSGININYLHNQILEIEKYPEIYEVIKKSLRE